MSQDTIDWGAVGMVKSSQYRSAVLDALVVDGVATPTELESATDYDITHVSRALGQLRDENLVECLTPDRRKGRMYRATDAGETVLEAL